MGARGDGGKSDGAADRELEITRSVLAVYEYRFGTPPAALVGILEEADDAAELSRWLSRVSKGSEAEIAADLAGAPGARGKRRRVTGRGDPGR